MNGNLILRMMIPRRNSLETPNQLELLSLLKKRARIIVVLPNAMQLEIYTVLRAKGYSFKNKYTGVRDTQKLSHQVFMKFAHAYSDIFDLNFLNGYRNITITDPYKDWLFSEIRYIANMSIEQSKEFIENKIEKNIDDLNDPYDYHIMASALKENADFLVSENTKDLANPLGKCQVIKAKELNDHLPFYR
jgi:hypothetical protein